MPSILVTGGTGLVGRAIVDALADVPVLSLTRHGAPGWSAGGLRDSRAVSSLLSAGGGHVVAACDADHVTHVHGDVTQPQLGLPDAVYSDLADQVKLVIHAAGVTDYTTPRAVTNAVNVTGTRHVARFAERADAPLYHVSTGYVRAQGSSVRGRFGAQVYLDSKREAESIAATCGTFAAMVRPSLVFGHSADGSTASFQGLHRLVGMVLQNRMPLLPFPAETRVDFLPRDVVGRAIARLARDRVHGDAWLTAGSDALTFGRVVELLLAFAAACGRQVDSPRFVSRDMIDRLIKPAGGAAIARRIDLLLALTSHLIADPLPSSLGANDRVDLEAALWRGTAFWAERNGWAAAMDPVSA
ncbi:MAG TPA: SDR family oxidoreductase [Conexibacter sp.]|jgi:thioester reductase-like protein|nr:SDR family oxidoreductase [Conexibacter sp.]